MSKLPNPTISFRIPIDLLKKLEKEAERDGVSKTKILNKLLEKHFKKAR